MLLRVAQFLNMVAASTLLLTIFLWDETTETCYTQLEMSNKVPDNVDQMKWLIFAEFVPSTEKFEAKFSLVALKRGSKTPLTNTSTGSRSAW